MGDSEAHGFEGALREIRGCRQLAPHMPIGNQNQLLARFDAAVVEPPPLFRAGAAEGELDGGENFFPPDIRKKFSAATDATEPPFLGSAGFCPTLGHTGGRPAQLKTVTGRPKLWGEPCPHTALGDEEITVKEGHW
eukprot:CAMPEP_0167813636 /NCGR_PEP_ID=MMETSP0112_2-20121227/1966_1 /TAXON_ID=91324 /ORGANISM="Lotharella globosa, Strain CCCM811" /LENGTH=135 /DNA_ID=CAMNT_0007712745 /DNA_START=21 /DNA_END=424 /DNA_ORIENTATION=+